METIDGSEASGGNAAVPGACSWATTDPPGFSAFVAPELAEATGASWGGIPNIWFIAGERCKAAVAWGSRRNLPSSKTLEAAKLLARDALRCEAYWFGFNFTSSSSALARRADGYWWGCGGPPVLKSMRECLMSSQSTLLAIFMDSSSPALPGAPPDIIERSCFGVSTSPVPCGMR